MAGRQIYNPEGFKNIEKDGSIIPQGNHHIKAVQIIAPSYMPFQLEPVCETDFEIK